MDENMVKTRKRRSKYAAPIGGMYIFLAVVGAVAVIWGGSNLIAKLTDNSKLLNKLARQIVPVMMFDPVPFDTIADADETMILKSSIWSTLYSDKRENYSYDDNSMMLIPVSDVDVAAAKLFGPDAKLNHRSIEDYEMSYIYDSENNVYRIPVMAQAGYYTPLVEELKKNGEYYDMKVGYVAPGADWLTDSEGNKYQPTPDKYMVYKMKKEKNEYYIVGIQDPGEAPIQSSSLATSK